jgi:hypothetical protein
MCLQKWDCKNDTCWQNFSNGKTCDIHSCLNQTQIDGTNIVSACMNTSSALDTYIPEECVQGKSPMQN